MMLSDAQRELMRNKPWAAGLWGYMGIAREVMDPRDMDEGESSKARTKWKIGAVDITVY